MHKKHIRLLQRKSNHHLEQNISSFATCKQSKILCKKKVHKYFTIVRNPDRNPKSKGQGQLLIKISAPYQGHTILSHITMELCVFRVSWQI